MRYVGRDPASDYAVATKKYVDDRHTAIAVDDQFLADSTASAASDAALVTPTYVDQQDGLRATKAAVDAADANYVPLTQKGVNSGLATIGSDGYVPSAQVPSPLTVRKPFVKTADQVFLTAQKTITTNNPREYEAARLTIADPGFPYIVLPFAMILGGSTTGTLNGTQLGTGNYAQLSIYDASLVKWGFSVTTAVKTMAYHNCLPWADSSINPGTRPAITGALTLSLWLGMLTGTPYTFDPTGLQFYALVYPAR